MKSVEKLDMTILFVTSRLKGAIRMSKSKELIVPIWKKSTLTIDEAAAYSGIGRNKLRSLSDKEDCPFVLWIGSKRLIKRKLLDEYINEMYSI